MEAPSPQSRILEAVAALRACDRRAAVRLLEQELAQGPPAGDRWKSVARLAGQIGEAGIAVESARRYAATAPQSLEHQLHYWGELAGYGRAEEARAAVDRAPPQIQRDPSVLHFLGTLAGQDGNFAEAERCYRAALAQAPGMAQTWFALAMIKTFAPGDPDLAAMERLRPAMDRADPAIRARFLYGLAKAWHDAGEFDRAFALYAQGAALRRAGERWDGDALERFAEGLIGDFIPPALARLTPSGEMRRALFVNGLPRSGTTLVEQILASHSQVVDGGEINLVRAALTDTGDRSLRGALAYQARFAGGDPWGALAGDYFDMLAKRFRTRGLVVDKTLGQSHFMGLLLHMLPGARVVWLRRDPEDTALSCFRTFFSSSVPWSWSLEDIGRFFRLEDRLHAHWSALFPERILTVDYQALVADPQAWIPRIAAHCGLAAEPAMFASHTTRRGVRTASVQQVRAPISTDRIGQARAYAAQLEPFRRTYRG